MGYSAFSGLGSGNSGNRRTVKQANDFEAGEVVRMSEGGSGLYVRAIADSASTSEAIGIIESATASTFTVVTAGEINLNGVTKGDLPVVAGDVYFLSSTTAGELTTTAPSVTGTIKKTMLIGIEQSKGIVVNYIGLVSGFDATDSVQLEGIQPLGSIIPYAGDINEPSKLPTGWLLCDGGQFNSADFPDLALLLGETHGPRVGNLYRLPDMRGRSPLGVNIDNSVMEANATLSTRPIGYATSAGKEEEILGVSQIPSHNHGGSYVVFKDEMGTDSNRANTLDELTYGFGTPSTSEGVTSSANTILMDVSGPILGTEWNQWSTGEDDQDYGKVYEPIQVDNSGGGLAHNNMHPFTVVNYLIRAKADFKASILSVNLRDLADVDSTSSCGGSCAGECNAPQNGDAIMYSAVASPEDTEPLGNGANKFVVTASSNSDRNVIINGNFDVWQRGSGGFASTTTSGSNTFYTADRWRFADNSASTFTLNEDPGHPFYGNTIKNVSPGHNTLQIFCTVGSEMSTSNYTTLNYDMEGYDFRRLWTAKCMTLSFWVKSNTVGTHCVSFRNAAGSLSYVAEYSIATANKWYWKTITIPLPNDRSQWSLGRARSMTMAFVTSAGADWHTTPNSWNSGNALATANQVNAAAVVDTTNPMLQIASVQLEAGSVATPFQQMHFDDVLIKCQRYFQKSYDISNYAGGVTTRGRRQEDDWVISNTAHFNCPFERRFRVRPAVTIYNPVTGAKDSYTMTHREGGSSTNHAVNTDYSGGAAIKGVHCSETNIDAITRTTATTINSGYKNKISFHYYADAEFYVDNNPYS